jgi:DNA-binding transcriptional MerR regulator
MTRPSPDDPFPFTRGDVAAVCGVTASTIKNLQHGKVLKKRPRGTGNWNGYDMDDALRIMVAKELIRVGLQVASIHSLFEAIQKPTAPSAKPWSWLRTAEARDQGACLVLLLSHRALSNSTGAAYITTLVGAAQWLGRSTAIVIDLNGFIRDLENRTGRSFVTAEP